MEALTPAVFHILLALFDEERHGYGIMQEIAQRTNGEIAMGPGTLYGTIQRMREAGLVEECSGKRDSKFHGQRRRYYRLTRNGRQSAVAEAKRLRQLVSDAYEKSLIPKPRAV
jgi:DNA-binding PadR family transcriptional regulator